MPSGFSVKCWMKRLYRHGPRFQHHFKSLTASRHLSSTELEAHQNYLLQQMIHHCYREIPYYRDLFRQLRLTPEDIQSPQDLIKLPYLDKHIVRENFDKLIDKKRRNFLCREGSTSGTTGTPGRFIRDYNSINFENAAVWRHWKNSGDTGKKRVSLRGGVVVPSTQNKPPFWKYNPADRELLMSSYHLSRESSQYYIDKILEFQPEILFCGPSAGFVLAKFFRHYNIDYYFDAIFTSSESLEPYVREYMEEVFHSRIHDWYGQAERVAAISQCSYGTYHIEEDYSVVELEPIADVAPIDGQPQFELLGSQLHNFVMPLIRYRTYDYVSKSYTACPCGSAFRPIENILGRTYNYLLTPEGYHIAITTHIPNGVANVIETQFFQEKAGEVILKVMTNGRFTEEDEEHLIRRTREHTSPHMKVIVEEVAAIPRGPGGKFVNVVSELEPVHHLHQPRPLIPS